MPDSETTGVPGVSDVDHDQFHLAFQRLQTQIEALPESDLEPINLDIPTTVATVLGAEPEVQPLRSALVALPTFDIRHVDQLRDRALALGHAHSQFRIAGGPPDDIDELVEQMIDARDRFHTDASALVRRGLLDGDRVNKLRGGNSYRMIAFDVIGLVGLFLESWDAINGKTALEVAELEEARATANRLVAAVGLREQGPALRSKAAIVRHKAYTLLVRGYNETRQAIAFVRRSQGDVDDITPSLYAGRGKRPPEPPAVVPEPTPEGAVPAGSAVPPGSAVPGSAVPGTAVPPGSAVPSEGAVPHVAGSGGAPVGFPGAAPLTKG